MPDLLNHSLSESVVIMGLSDYAMIMIFLVYIHISNQLEELTCNVGDYVKGLFIISLNQDVEGIVVYETPRRKEYIN